MRNYYYILGLSETASHEDIKSAFRKLAVKYHPDKHQGDLEMEEKFKSINEAYQILSDPYKKAQFDHQLQYKHFHQTQPQRTSYPRSATSYYRPRYYGYRGRPINYKENAKGTLYAFAITFGIAVIVLIIKGFYDLYLQEQYNKMLAERRKIFNEAQVLYDKNEFRNSFMKLSEISPFLPEEVDMGTYQKHRMQEIILKGEENYLNKDFKNAVWYFELAEQFSNYRPNSLKYHLARSYRHIGKSKKSIQMLKQLIEAKYEVINSLVEIGEIYWHELNDMQKARQYIELARDVAVRNYESQYGRAYMLVIDEKRVPRDHFYLYENLALFFNEINEPDHSLGATGWMKQLWPDSIQSYVLAGRSYEMKNNRRLACSEYATAKSLGYPDELPCP